MKFLIVLFFVCTALLLLNNCNTTEPPPPPETKPVLTLSFDKKSCTELWIKLTTKDLTLPAELTLKQYNPSGDSVTQNFSLSTNDSLIYIDSLFPNNNYYYQVSSIQSATGGQVSSNKLAASTLDTTSHNFTYQTFEFGEPLTGNSSRLYDVAIINENDIWAVGEIYVNDSLGQADPIPYNVVRWNGTSWELKRVYFPVVCGQSNLIPYPSRSINVFSDNEIWMSTGGDKIAVVKEGIQINQFCLPSNLNMSINKIWGNSKSNFYVIGNEGKIGYYNGTSWTNVTSGTNLPLTDIFGKDDNEIYAVGINVSDVKGVVLKGNSNGFSVMINSEIISENELFDKLFGSLDAIWLDENNTIYTAGNLMFQYKNNKWDYVRSLPENFISGNPGTYYRGFISSIRGNASNDYVIAGDRNTLKHFNGISWQQIGLPYNPQSQISLIAKQKGNTVVAVGSNGSKAFIILLNR
ncbi:MAG TPA: glucosyl transferase [Ignavibacteriales bacterium]|nr:glucosyl transferase [Ignavibacteriales bacterium]